MSLTIISSVEVFFFVHFLLRLLAAVLPAGIRSHAERTRATVFSLPVQALVHSIFISHSAQHHDRLLSWRF